jgi:hypothetical protein
MKVLVLVISSDSPEYAILERTQRETWARESHLMTTIWSHLKPVSKTTLSNGRLEIPGTEKFDSILEKTIEAARWSLKNLDFDLFVRANLSSYLNFSMLDEEEFSANDLYAGFIGHWTDPLNPNEGKTPFVSGSAISLTRNILESVAQADYREWCGIPDDVAIAKIVARQGIFPSPQKRITIPDGQLIRPSFNSRLKINESTDVTAKLMKKLHEVYSAGSRKDLKRAIRDFDDLSKSVLQIKGLTVRQKLTRGSRVRAFDSCRGRGVNDVNQKLSERA